MHSETHSYIVGIAGGTGSGKTTLCKKLDEEFGPDAAIITHDSYYYPHSDMTLEERMAQNYDHPDSLDTPLMINQLNDLKAGRAVEVPVYSFVEYTRTDKTIRVEPSRIIIVEGILLFANKELTDTFDMKIYVDVDADIRFIRRLLRDVKERGRTIESVVDQYIGTVKPMHEQFVEQSKKNADIIIPGGANNPVAMQMIVDRLKTVLAA